MCHFMLKVFCATLICTRFCKIILLVAIFRAAYEDMVCRMKKVQGLSVAEEETSYEEKLELGKNRDEEEIRLGSDVSKNEEMVEKTKRNSGEIRVRNFALTETDLGIKYRGCCIMYLKLRLL